MTEAGEDNMPRVFHHGPTWGAALWQQIVDLQAWKQHEKLPVRSHCKAGAGMNQTDVQEVQRGGHMLCSHPLVPLISVAITKIRTSRDHLKSTLMSIRLEQDER